MSTLPIHNGDHAEFEIEHANTKPEDRPDWPYPSFDARDWAKAFCKIAGELGLSDKSGKPIDEEWMATWFANSLMRGWDEHGSRTHSERISLLSGVRKLVGEWRNEASNTRSAKFANVLEQEHLLGLAISKEACAIELQSLLAQHPEGREG